MIALTAFLLVMCRYSSCLDVRLIFGLSLEHSNRGRVEVYHEEEWGTICTDGWDDNDAIVVCRMLGYDSGRAFYDGFFSSGRGRIWLSDVRCEGSVMFNSLPSDLSECKLGKWGETNCTHGMDAGAWCVNEHDVILVNGTFNSGRVEIFHDGTYGSICAGSFDDRNADVLCRMAGFKSGGIAYTGGPFGGGNATAWLTGLQCSGSELLLKDCGHRKWRSGDCNHSENIGVYCYAGKWTSWSPCSATCGPSVRTRRIACVGYDSDPMCRFKSETQDCVNPDCLRTRIRLRGSYHDNRGRVEVFHSFRWGSICDDEWGDREATVVCRMLGFVAGKAYRGSYFGGGSGKIWMDDVNCSPNFNGGVPVDIADCSHRGWGRHNCHHDEDAGVWCVRGEDDVVLVNGSSSSGRVEIYHREMFGTICDSNFNDVNADVICSMVGYRGGLWHGNAYYGRGSGAIWMVNVNCSKTYSDGPPATLSDCRHDGWGIVSCHHGKDVGVQCFNILDGAWSLWTAWTTCSMSCDTGIHHRIRLCDNPAPRFNGKSCEGPAIEEKNCSTGIHCPIDGGLTEWSAWVDCSATCEFGNHWRSRNCSNPVPKFGGQECSGKRIEHKRCNVGIRCPIHGQWNTWTHWSLCSVTCRSGMKRRSRVCDKPQPRFGGRICIGSLTQSKSCSTSMNCPFDGNWGSWSEWGSCSVSCANGIQQRFRFCDDPDPIGRGEDCDGEQYQKRVCKTSTPCPVHGTRWVERTRWHEVTTTNSPRDRSRDCTEDGDCIDEHLEIFETVSPYPDRNTSCTSSGGEIIQHNESFTTVTKGECIHCHCINGEHTNCQTIECDDVNMTTEDTSSNDLNTFNSTTKDANDTLFDDMNNVNMTTGFNHSDMNDVNMATGFNYTSSDDMNDVNMTTGFNYTGSGEMNNVNMTTGYNNTGYNNMNNVNMTTGLNSTGSGDSDYINTTTGSDNTNNANMTFGNNCSSSNYTNDANMTTSNNYNSSLEATEPLVTDAVTNPTEDTDWGNSTEESRVTNNGSLKQMVTTTERSSTPYFVTAIKSVAGRWSSWTEWSVCSVTCAVGAKTRTRTCVGTVSDKVKIGCYGKTEEKVVCFTGISCGAIGITWPTKTLTKWSSWTTCSSTCKGGFRKRSRICDVFTDPASCDGDTAQKELCNENVICSNTTQQFDVWSVWSDWSSCSVTCSVGSKKRTRTCAASQAGGTCVGRGQEKAVCFTRVSCGVDVAWGEWSLWSSCAVTCGFGTRGRSRICKRPSPFGTSLLCKGNDYEISTCTRGGPCKYLGKTPEPSWNNWSEWSVCSATCENGTRNRSRACLDVDGLPSCKGSTNETEECSVNTPCPVDGSWSTWSGWTTCTVTCGGKEGEKRRFRECNNPAPMHGGIECVGVSMEIHTCHNDIVCSVDGGWSKWSTWTRCSVTCDYGQRTRHRRCDLPVPEGTGHVCDGDHTAVEDCNMGQQCPPS